MTAPRSDTERERERARWKNVALHLMILSCLTVAYFADIEMETAAKCYYDVAVHSHCQLIRNQCFVTAFYVASTRTRF